MREKKVGALVWAALVATIVGGSCRGRAAGRGAGSSVSGGERMAVDDSTFAKVRLNSNEPNPCSPHPPAGDWRGVVIQAPAQVKLQRVNGMARVPAIPVCGYYLVDVVPNPDGDRLRLVAVDRKGRVFAGEVVSHDRSPDEPPPPSEPLSAEDLKGLASGGYFNPNLAEFVALPAAPARYQVHVELKGHESNVVTIAVVP